MESDLFVTGNELNESQEDVMANIGRLFDVMMKAKEGELPAHFIRVEAAFSGEDKAACMGSARLVADELRDDSGREVSTDVVEEVSPIREDTVRYRIDILIESED